MTEIKEIHLDIETFSSVDLGKSGVYRYATSPDFEVLLLGYSVDGGAVNVIDLANGENLPEELIEALRGNSVIKYAHNSAFERVCLSRFLEMPVGSYLDPKSWRCTMVWSAYMGLPLSLLGVGAVLGLEKQKLAEGKDLIRYFCMPCSPTKANSGRVRNLPEHDVEKWSRFKAYNIRDVEAEMQIAARLKKFPVPDYVWEEYWLNENINDRGVLVDMDFVNKAITIDGIVREKLTTKIQSLTDLDNPNSVVQMKSWLNGNGVEMESLGKKDVAAKIKEAEGNVAEVLAIRQQLAKSSVKKYTAMNNAVCSDNRVRGMFQFYGANRTGRFTSKIVQLQNLPQNHIQDLAEARELVRSGNYEALEMLYEDIPDTLSQLIRTAFIPRPRARFFVADFSAIEARVIAYLAKESWRSDVFKNGGDIYCASATQMFGVPVEKHGINGHLRQKGKIAELALGYGGSVGALKSMGALEMGLTEEELQPLVDAWRMSNPNIVKLWWDVDRAVKKAVKDKTEQATHGIRFCCRSGMLFITLLSGRQLAYVKPQMGTNRFGGESVTYEGVGSTKKWERIESYGPKFVENIVQAISRDLLLFAIRNLSDYSIVAHCHDELIIEAVEGMSLKTVCEEMSKTPPWAEGLLLRADGYECNFYKKD